MDHMTDETTSPAPDSPVAPAAITLPSYAEASTDASVPQTELQTLEAELHKLLAWVETLSHEVAAELKSGFEVLLAKVKSVI